jgi:hypothetical protein
MTKTALTRKSRMIFSTSAIESVERTEKMVLLFWSIIFFTVVIRSNLKIEILQQLLFGKGV